MQFQGYSVDNLHRGDVRITGNLEVDRDMEIKGDVVYTGDVKIEPPNCLSTDCINSATPATGIEINTEYKLPVVKGTANQVLTQVDALGNCEFKDAAGGITGYFYRNLFTMSEANTNFTANPAVINNLYTSGTGNLNLGSIDNFPINSTIKWYARGRLDLTSNPGIVNADGRFQLTINESVVAPATPINYFTDISSLSTGGTQPNSMFAIDICITRIASNSYRFNGYGQFSSGSTGTLTMDWNDVLLTPPVAYTTWEMKLGYYYLGVNIARPITETLTCDLIVDTSALIAAPPAPTSHTALTDLTLGDAGHTQFALLQGRSGGQILSGGITPLHDLKLKSHNVGLDNIIVRDLKTEFKKNIDMDGNSITNLQNIDTNNQPLNILSGSAFPQLNLTGGINCNNTAFFYQCPSVYAGTGNLVLGSDTLGTEIQTGPFGSRQTEMSILPNLINVNSAFTNFLGNNITMAQGRIQDLKRVDGGGAGSNFIEMVDAGFLNAINISSNAGAIMQETTSTNNIGILSTGGGMAVAVGDLQIRNADPAGSLNIVKQFGGNINLDSAGLVVVNNSDLDMNNNNIINVSGINGFTPVGGIYAGTSDGTLINNTTEQSVLPGSGVGSLTIPANTFQVGDSFHCVVAGDCSLENKDEIQIKLKENGNILAQTPVFEVEDANVGGNAFEIEIDFTIRSIGATGSIATNFDFSYNKDGTDSKDFRGTRAMDVQPIDTTVASTLEITVQFPTNVASSLQTRLFRLQKVY
jgi:hypothetical protein